MESSLPKPDAGYFAFPIPGRGSSQRGKICRYYQEHGSCRFGTGCRFLHSDPINTQPNENPRSSAPAPKSKPMSVTFSAGAFVWQRDSSESKSEEQQQRVPGAPAVVLSDRKPMRPVNADTDSSSNLPAICKYYLMRGRCQYGDQCRFAHIKPGRRPKPIEKSPPETKPENNDVSTANQDVDKQPAPSDTPSSETAVVPSSETITAPSGETPAVNALTAPSKVFPAGVISKNIADLTDDEVSLLRNTEIQQLERRFVGGHYQLVQEDPEQGSVYDVTVAATDPDWPYDVKDVRLRVVIPAVYPRKPFGVSVIADSNECFPVGLVHYLNSQLQPWVDASFSSARSEPRVQLMFRPFLRWFDRNLENLFTTGLRRAKQDMDVEAAGLEFVPFENLLNGQNHSTEDKDDDDSGSPDSPDDPFQHIPEIDQPENKESSEAGIPNEACLYNAMLNPTVVKQQQQDAAFSPSKRGTEIKFREFQLDENVASLNCLNLSVMIQCQRCKTQQDLHTPAQRVNLITCEKCQHRMQLVFRPALMHPYSSILGYVDLEGCSPFDLLLAECKFTLTCLSCDKRMPLDGVHSGQARTVWCHACNVKLNITLGSAKFHQLQAGNAHHSGPKFVVRGEKKPRVRDPAVQEGKPLPDNGTCRHYKKSFRWFRSPCCGKAYPCDVCHDEREDHEMDFASRIICGFCAKEQPFTNKLCIGCTSAFSRTGRAHWEGGKGCRDKVRMSVNDRHKYTGQSKTIAKKTTGVAATAKK